MFLFCAVETGTVKCRARVKTKSSLHIGSSLVGTTLLYHITAESQQHEQCLFINFFRFARIIHGKEACFWVEFVVHYRFVVSMKLIWSCSESAMWCFLNWFCGVDFFSPMVRKIEFIEKHKEKQIACTTTRMDLLMAFSGFDKLVYP